MANSGTDLDRSLLPRARPTAALVCRYDGLIGHPFRRITSRALGTMAARAIADGINRLSLADVDSGQVSACPMDDDSALIAAFSLPGRPDVDLWEWTSGCGWLSNGHIGTRFGGDILSAAGVL